MGDDGTHPGCDLAGATPDGGVRVVVVIPALDEEESLPQVLASIPRAWCHRVVVADNGSSDGTAAAAREGGALVVHEPRRGYGAACLAGVRQAGEADILVFLDADNSDDPRELPLLVAPLLRKEADLVIGSRTLGRRERGALLPHARLGNAVAGLLVRLLLGTRITDLGPFRALTAEAYRRIAPTHPGYGFPMQTQARAIALGLRVVEVPVSYRRRLGRSKISGTLRGTCLAGWAIITTILAEWWRARSRRRGAGSPSPGPSDPARRNG